MEDVFPAEMYVRISEVLSVSCVVASAPPPRTTSVALPTFVGFDDEAELVDVALLVEYAVARAAFRRASRARGRGRGARRQCEAEQLFGSVGISGWRVWAGS